MKVTKMFEFTPLEVIQILTAHVEARQHVTADAVSIKIRGPKKVYSVRVLDPVPQNSDYAYLESIVVSTKEEK